MNRKATSVSRTKRLCLRLSFPFFRDGGVEISDSQKQLGWSHRQTSLSLSPASKLLTVCKRPVLQTDERELRDVFGKYGEIKDVHLPTDRETGRLRGFAFLSYNDTRDCDDALAAQS